MNLNIFTYLCGSFFIITSIFTFSDYYSEYLYNKLININDKNKKNVEFSDNKRPINKIKELEKKEKLNECIYSSIHGILSSSLAILSLNSISKQPDNEMQYLAASLCYSYFIVDLFHCLYNQKYLFVMHHIASIIMLTNVMYSFYNGRNIGYYVMYNIFLLESNTVLLNIGFLLKEFKFHYSITCMSWIIHLLCFVSFRLLMLPILIIKFYMTEPFTTENLLYIPNFMLIMSGSVYWAYRQTIGIKKYLKENSVI